ncbi:hypothetical protein ACWFOS_18905 [Gordonia terrae]
MSAWSDLDIPDEWESASMLRNLVVDHLSGESGDLPLDDATRERMVGLAVMTTVELAGKVAGITRILQQLVELLGEGD